jgi:aminocarboxymuconate-semialdehyde decarboxylase
MTATANSNPIKIDIHTHILPEHMPRYAQQFGYDGFLHLEHHKPCCAKMMIGDTFFREVEDNCWSPEKRIQESDEAGVNVQVLSTVPVLFYYWAKPKDTLAVAQFLNDHIAEIVQRYPTRYIGLGTLPMQDPELAVGELTRCVQELGLPGVQIGSNVNQLNLSDPQFWPVFEAAERLGACVFVHPWEMMGEADMKKYWLPWLVGMPAETSRAICSMIFGGIFEKFPALRVAFAHGGGSFPSTIGRVEHGFKVRPDLCAIDNPVNPRNYIGRFYVDALVHDPLMLRYLVSVMGEDFVALGTDYPFPLGEWLDGKWLAGELISSIDDFSPKVKDKLLYQNALRWLNLESFRFE